MLRRFTEKCARKEPKKRPHRFLGRSACVHLCSCRRFRQKKRIVQYFIDLKSIYICSKTSAFTDRKPLINLFPSLFWFRRHFPLALFKKQFLQVFHAVLYNLMARSNGEKNVDENIPLDIIEGRDDDDLEVIFVNSNMSLEESPISSLPDELISGSTTSVLGKFSSCAAASSSSSSSGRLSPMMCAFHVNNHRIAPLIGGKNGATAVSKCKVRFYLHS